MANVYTSETFGISSNENRLISPFSRVAFRYIFNREKREKRKRSAINNVGNYITPQNKMSFGGSEFGNIMLNEFHWETQLPLGRDMLFETHIGLGHIKNLTHKGKVFIQ